MVDEKEICLWINRLKTEETSWSNYEKLAALYIVQDHQNQKDDRPAPPIAMYSASPAPEAVRISGDSDFLRAVDGKDPEKAWEIMDELLDTLKVVNRKVYDNVMRKLQAI